ncbi:hypothetical protein CEXT_243171 [Caerostris extrusa]|uniref:LAGLIDADG homing endonuclease n=1 Tax=Caerostris extrusa TaxID=172846 RepID=A0AAV4S0Z9_CAEEX|nr:hypothetical protein CEXT_243171 [Caerostris extrusa]
MKTNCKEVTRNLLRLTGHSNEEPEVLFVDVLKDHGMIRSKKVIRIRDEVNVIQTAFGLPVRKSHFPSYNKQQKLR